MEGVDRMGTSGGHLWTW